MANGLSHWWEGIELWLAQQWFPVQFVLVMAVLTPLCVGLSWVIQRIADGLTHRVRQFRMHRKSDRRSSGGQDAVS